MRKVAKLFAKYKVCSKNCYGNDSPVKVFQKTYPDNHYSKELEVFLSYQDYLPTQRGADLSWWGKDYFSGKKGFRVMVIGQDSKAKDAGSVVFFTHLMLIISGKVDYQKHIKFLHTKFSFNSWDKIKKWFAQCNIDLDYLYVTDGKKVYKEGSLENDDFDKKKSKELLEEEIDLCSPDLIVILGASSLSLLDKSRKYNFTAEEGKVIEIRGRRCIVAPFPIGLGRIQHNFEKRLSIATHLIKHLIKS